MELDAFQAAPLDESPHVIDDLARALVVLADVGEDGAHLLEVRRALLQQQLGGLRVAQDGSQRLVQLVSQARSQLGHRGQATDVGQLGLQSQHLDFALLAGGDVHADTQHAHASVHGGVCTRPFAAIHRWLPSGRTTRYSAE